MRFFTVSELYGPFSCEHPGCKKITFTIRLTAEENKLLPEESGHLAVKFIFDHHLGKAVCSEHKNA